MNSCQKGKEGERELARYLTERGLEARRGQQHRGGTDSPDVLVEALPQFHFEVKRTERLRLWEAIDQAREDAAGGRTPLVVHRPSRRQWVAILDLDDLLELLCPCSTRPETAV